MNKLWLTLTATTLALGIRAEIFTIDPGHAEIGFSVKHMMVSNTKGNFGTFRGTIDYDPETKMLLAMQAVIEASSINTNNEKRDGHLKNEDFFNVTTFPELTFTSTSIKKNADGTFEVSGKLNVLGIDREIVLPVTVNGPVDDPWGFQRIGVESETVLNRHQLGITHSASAIIGDDVEISIAVEAVYKK
ncbi:MAG: YceI family protein [Pontiella sp.]